MNVTMTLARVLILAAVILFVLAALGGFGWLIHTSALVVLGLIALGLACSNAAALV